MAVYDDFALQFARTREQIWPDLEEVVSHPLVLTHLTLDIVDIGCGSGRLLDYILPRVPSPKYTGYDVSPGMIQEARLRYPGYEFEVQDMLATTCVWGVDMAFYIASFHHLLTEAEQSRALESLSLALKDGGIAVFLNWNLRSEKLLKKYPPVEGSFDIRYIPFAGSPRSYRVWYPDELSSFLESAGFAVCTASVTRSGANLLHIVQKK